MGLLVDHQIRRRAEAGMISPFEPKQVRAVDGKPVVSWGLSSAGYDLRVADQFKVFTNVHSTVIDVKNPNVRSFVDVQGDICIIPPNSFALARSVEYFDLPRDVLMVVLGKSTWARAGIVTNVTPGEPGWRGYLTLEISNTTPLPAKIYANEGLCQCLFFATDALCEISYADRLGKYQGQPAEPVPSRV